MNLFDIIPSGFFNSLASNSNQRLYADCILLIYEEYEREISYRISRKRIRDAVSLYLLENSVELTEEEFLELHSVGDMASAIIRKLASPEVGWLEEETDDTTYEKHIMMTENGVALAEFLTQLKKPEKEEYSSYIFNIYNTLNNPEQWKEDPYVDGIKNVNRNAKLLSKSLKKLSTFIRKIIEKMVREQSFESLTENVLEYCDGNFIREYSRLTKQQNIHIYRSFIQTRLNEIMEDEELYGRIIEECMREEALRYQEAESFVYEMFASTKRFLVEDYNEIMKEIKHKINLYLQIAIGRARFIRNREKNIRGAVEQTLRYMMDEMKEVDAKDELVEEMQCLFTLERNEFIDLGSIKYPRKNRVITNSTEQEVEELSEENIEAARQAQKHEAYNPYSKELMKLYLEKQLGEKKEIVCEELPLEEQNDLLASLSAVAYAKDNGYRVESLDGYLEVNGMMLRRFRVTRED